MTVEERRAIDARLKAIEGEMEALREERIGLRKKILDSITGPALARLNAVIERRRSAAIARVARRANREANPVPFNERAEREQDTGREAG